GARRAVAFCLVGRGVGGQQGDGEVVGEPLTQVGGPSGGAPGPGGGQRIDVGDLVPAALGPAAYDLGHAVRIVQRSLDHDTPPVQHDLAQLRGQQIVAGVAAVVPARRVGVVGPRGTEDAALAGLAAAFVAAGVWTTGDDPHLVEQRG